MHLSHFQNLINIQFANFQRTAFTFILITTLTLESIRRSVFGETFSLHCYQFQYNEVYTYTVHTQPPTHRSTHAYSATFKLRTHAYKYVCIHSLNPEINEQILLPPLFCQQSHSQHDSPASILNSNITYNARSRS